MGRPLTIEEIRDACKHPAHQNLKTFVETGTHRGDTTFLVAKTFENVFITHFHKGLYKDCVKKARMDGVENISFYLGDNVKMLKEIMPRVDSGVFYIGAHINGQERVPILEELDTILSYDFGPSVFIVDDLRRLKETVLDGAHISGVEIVKKLILKNKKIVYFGERSDKFYISVL